MAARKSTTPHPRPPTPAVTGFPSIACLGRRLAALSVEHDRREELSLTDKGDSRWATEVIAAQKDALHALISTIPAVTIEDAVVQIATATRLVDDLTADGPREYEIQQARAAVDRLLLSALPVMATAAGLDVTAMGWGDLANLTRLRFEGVEGVR